MHLTYRNVNEAFYGLVGGIHDGLIPTYQTSSRNGEVLMIEEPVIVTYTHPRERVLINKERDANPFFHLYEALWMLAGRNDIAPLNYYCGNRYTNYSDDGETANGAYGYRWRHGRRKTTTSNIGDTCQDDIDQLTLLVNHLRDNPNSRRAVLSMWNVHDDLLRIDTQGYGISKDVCCNLSVCFSVRQATCSLCEGKGSVPSDTYDSLQGGNPCPKCLGTPHDQPSYLDMTVFNRSNDLIWGMLGANVVHFSILQEYVANKLDYEVGVYNQISNNLHVYSNNWEPEKWLACDPTTGILNETPLIRIPKNFDEGLNAVVLKHGMIDPRPCVYYASERFLTSVAAPMFEAYHAHKDRNYPLAFHQLSLVQDKAWRVAGMGWMEKRRFNYMKKMNGASDD